MHKFIMDKMKKESSFCLF